MDQQKVNFVYQKILEINSKVEVLPLDYYHLKSELPDISDDELIKVLFHLEKNGRIISRNTVLYHGISMIKNFDVTS